MEIINGNEVYEPSECYFTVGKYDGCDAGVAAVITPIAFFEENGCLDDSFGDHSFRDGVIPDSMYECMESTWETELSVDEARKILLDAGFVENEKFAEFVHSDMDMDEELPEQSSVEEEDLPQDPSADQEDPKEDDKPQFDLYQFLDLKYEDIKDLDHEQVRQFIWGRMRDKIGVKNEDMIAALSKSLVDRAEEITLDMPNLAPYGDYEKLIESNDEMATFLKTEACKPENWEAYGFSTRDMLTEKALISFVFWNNAVDDGKTLEGTVFVSKYGKIKHCFPQYSD
jgi:hypothetical protein